jgi:hypothetical protein
VWPTVTVTAAPGATRLNWRMIDTSSQPQTDAIGSCSVSGFNPFPQLCDFSGGVIKWTRMLTDMPKRIVIGVWAEDAAGNGAVTDTTQQANCNVVTCVTLFVDVEPPALTFGAVTIHRSANEVRIEYFGSDSVSQVFSIGRPPLTSGEPAYRIVTQSIAVGELVLSSSGEPAGGRVTVTDYANNSRTYTVLFQGIGQPLQIFDGPIPEVFNQFDPASPGRCRTTIDDVPYLCTNKVYGSVGSDVTPLEPIAVKSTKWGGGDDADDDDDRDWKGKAAELQTYLFADPSSDPANTVMLVEKVRLNGNEARVRVMSLQYTQGEEPGVVIVPDRGDKKYEWSKNADGSLKSLTQKFEVRQGKNRSQVIARYDAKTNTTEISELGPGSRKVIAPGLVLLRMTTSMATLQIDYTVTPPVVTKK